ncbi:MAG TPA: hypothetical protein VJH92_00745 [Candidatus Nanoarchaeia archaeon]|nr:hypothetical protein [Candidatus Nanoarchaeia archaeon]
MEIRELMEFTTLEDKRLKEKFGHYADEEKRTLARTVKVGEEYGELCDEILSRMSLQRKEKLSKKDKENLEKEFTDVIISTLLLAKNIDVDVAKAIENKIIEINKRY